MQNELYSGITTLVVGHDVLDELYQNKKIPLYELPPEKLYENQYAIVRNGTETGSALARVKAGNLHVLDQYVLNTATDVKPRNKEQYCTMDALMDDSVRVVTLTGTAGSGKSLMALAAAMTKMKQGKYKKLILTKPMSQVGNRDLGILPGGIEEKFMPFLLNYMTNLEVIFGRGSAGNLEIMMKKHNVEIVPLQLMRGASFNECLILADEIQVLNAHETLTLGTRVSEGSKLVMMGDLAQRDEHIAKHDTGLFKFVNSDGVRRNPIAAQVHLLKSERGAVAELFSNTFPDT